MTASLPVPQDPRADDESGEDSRAPEQERARAVPPRPKVSAAEAAAKAAEDAGNVSALPAKRPAPRAPRPRKVAGSGTDAASREASGTGASAPVPNETAPPRSSKTPGPAPRKTPTRAPRKKTPRTPAPVVDPGPPPPPPLAAQDLVIPPRPPLPPAPEPAVVEPPAEGNDPETPAVAETAVDATSEPAVEAEPATEAGQDAGPADAGPEVVDATSEAESAEAAPGGSGGAATDTEAVAEPAEAALVGTEGPDEAATTVEAGPSPVDVGPFETETGTEPASEPEAGAATVDADATIAAATGGESRAEPVTVTEPAAAVAGSPAEAFAASVALSVRGVTKSFGDTRAVDGIDLTVPAGTFYGLVGPNGAGKTTTLSMIAGLLRPDRGTISIDGVDAGARPRDAKRLMGVLPDRLRTFDRLTGRQLLYYCGVLRGLDPAVVESRTADLARAFDLVDALGRPVSDYSAGMTKKVMLAGAMIHSPRLLVLDEPFEAVDPVSSAVILDILSTYVAHGGTVILSSHGMELVERVCSRVAVIVAGQVLAEGTIDEVRGELTLEQRFVELAGGLSDVEGLEWLHTFSG